MLKEIKGNNKLQQVKEFVKEADRMIAEYGWQDKTVIPYSFPVKITEIIDNLRRYEGYTRCSQQILIAEANGLPHILNYWEEIEKAPKVKIQLMNGIIKEVSQIVAEELIYCEAAVLFNQ